MNNAVAAITDETERYDNSANK